MIEEKKEKSCGFLQEKRKDKSSLLEDVVIPDAHDGFVLRFLIEISIALDRVVKEAPTEFIAVKEV